MFRGISGIVGFVFYCEGVKDNGPVSIRDWKLQDCEGEWPRGYVTDFSLSFTKKARRSNQQARRPLPLNAYAMHLLSLNATKHPI